MGEATCSAVKSFFREAYMLKEITHTYLVLIPKVCAPEKLSQFRPISLCNFNMKIVTKILAIRLKKVLGALISLSQLAFVSSRLIQDNIIVAHEALHALKLQRGKTNS